MYRSESISLSSQAPASQGSEFFMNYRYAEARNLQMLDEEPLILSFLPLFGAGVYQALERSLSALRAVAMELISP